MVRDIAANLKLHWGLAFLILVCDLALTIATIYLEKTNTDPIPQGGALDKSAPIGWLSVFAALFCFGTYGICMKTPSVEQANVDVMVWQVPYSYTAAIVLFAIWLCTGASDGLTFSASSLAYGIAFAVLWIASQLMAFKAIQILGFAVAPAIWIGVTIIVSFLWGSLAFQNPVHNVVGAASGLALLILGVRLATLADKMAETSEVKVDVQALAETETSASTKGSPFLGFICAVVMGLLNGTMMAPMTCFSQGCFGTEPFDKSDQIPAMAFLPSLAAGIAISQPVMFLLYWGPSMMRGVYPKFHAKAITGPAVFTGVTWAMGNFNAMFGTVYLGQTIGFPLTQCCLVLNGILGIAYFQELQGRGPIGLFCLASLIIFAGAGMDGLFA